MTSAAKYRRQQRDIKKFLDALRAFMDVLEEYGAGALQRAEAAPESIRLKGEVELASGPAAYAFHSAGAFIDWKARGTFQEIPINPAASWATILTSFPKFAPEDIYSSGNQALGILRMREEEAEEREQRNVLKRAAARMPRVGWSHLSTFGKVAWSVAAPVIAAALIYWFGLR